MTYILKIAQSLLASLLLLMGMTLSGQNNIHFSYESRDIIKSPTKVIIILKSPDKGKFNLLTDTVSDYSFSEMNYFKSPGKYILSISFEAEKYGKDSLDYDFELNGYEIFTVISVAFDYRERLIKKEDIFVKGEKVLNGYIRLCKYYDAPKSVNIELDEENTGDEVYKGPVFKIINKSKDTLYGEHLPGYFWGTLFYIRNDSILAIKSGIIDYEFVDSPPLYPGATKVATVGSFGLTKKLFPFEYSYEVMLSDKWQSQGIGVYKERQNFVWWAGTNEYYKLKYDFKVDELTPNR
jgi:hypothetical protein